MVHTAVVGGGIGGLAVGLFLGRRGHRVTILERETRCAGADLDTDFLHWTRPASPQAVQPHSLLGPVRTVLNDLAPDVHAELLALGATEQHELHRYGPPQPEPGDEELVTTRARRIVLESALTRAVLAEPTVELRNGVGVTGLLTTRPARAEEPPRVTGVRTEQGGLPADLVIEAAGRRSGLARWLAAAGARPPVQESQRTSIAYFCRWYRRPAGATEPEPTTLGGATAYANCAVFPCDNGYFAVALSVSVADPTRARLRDPAVFDAAARLFPGTAAWLELDHQPVTPVHIMAGLENRWTALVDEQGPVVTGLVSLGDSAIHTNPTLGQGIPLAFRAAHWLACHADLTHPGLPTAYHRWRVEHLRPWYEAQAAVDRAGQDRLQAAVTGAPLPPLTGDALLKAALGACGREDPAVGRARLHIRHLLRTDTETLATPAIRTRVEQWLRANPEFAPGLSGPDRATWETTVTGS
ncbi:FAD-dependent oxidoreductase [Kitasatospora sp. MMS16-BH015]|uniref:NAD(P)/FAD-dependent oxidoreductase n=1 Tax=Kitasatospora sp. MMS16-BH015 TaxID=2018025 RepID=UPI000CA0A18D|nr:NAD(P)-binding protein [Kitasatospora sp. MMS16-BH015]AUG80232.1 FAD-dependent oxidoreductase [Kitasatospora sp. MMS16-BH015]